MIEERKANEGLVLATAMILLGVVMALFVAYSIVAVLTRTGG